MDSWPWQKIVWRDKKAVGGKDRWKQPKAAFSEVVCSRARYCCG